jgi:quercetin dioxygenase-like cupin family protein
MMRTPQLVLALAIGMAAGAVIAAQEPPTENKGMEAKPLAGFDIGKQGLHDLDERQMRAREIDIAPGGAAAFHSHAQRPALSYVMKGELLEHRQGAPDRVYKAGEVITETTDVNHWAENKGSEPVVIISVDLFKQ